jgi:3-hydroxyacyl-CoA dehydrogenase/enoyl-CoA hydratase/3-hydroxybutyryl-CoA epimerase
MAETFTITIDDSIATVAIDLPDSKVNIINQQVMEEFDHLLGDLRGKKGALKGAILISGKEDTFIAGADISLIEQIDSKEHAADFAREGQRIFNTLAGLPFPVVAAIHGACLGGGLELALSCSHRVVSDSPKTFLGLPEIQLGIIPGFGGTQRLPRLVGLIEALKMITSGNRVFAGKAVRIGLADAIAPKEHLLDAALKLIREGKPKKSARSTLQKYVLEANPLGRSIVFSKTRAAVAKKVGDNYPAPFAAIDAVKTGLSQGMRKGLEREAELLGELAVTDVSKRLINVFRLREKFTHVDRKAAHSVNNVGVIGAGVMGGGIAMLAAENNMQVRLMNRSTKGLGRFVRFLNKTTGEKRRKGVLSPLDVDWLKSRLSYDTAVRGLQSADLVIEAIAEDMDIKKITFAEVAQNTRPATLILSNTSSLSVTEMATVVPEPARVAGLHFFNPVDKMPLVEIIKGDLTSDATVDALKGFARRLGKIPVVVKDRPGFLVNRLLLPYLNEAARMLEDGVPMQAIDQVLLRFGMPMGAFYLLDVVGLDIAFHVGEILHKGLGDRLAPSPVLKTLFDAGRLGKKAGKGFYRYDQNGRREYDPELMVLLKEYCTGDLILNEEEIVERAVLAMINEAAYCLEEEVVVGPDAVDAAMIFGAGFPAYTGGLLRYADNLRVSHVVARLVGMSASYGKRFEPAKLLQDMALQKKTFYAS